MASRANQLTQKVEETKEEDKESEEEESFEQEDDESKPQYSKTQKEIKTIKALIPDTFLQKGEETKQYLIDAITQKIAKIQKNSVLNSLNDPQLKMEQADLYQDTLEMVFIAYTLINNFRINLRDPFLAEVLVLSFRAIENYGFNMDLKMRIFNYLKKMPLQSFDLRPLEDYVVKNKTWIRFFDFFESNNIELDSKINVGWKIKHFYRDCLIVFLYKVQKIFRSNFKEIFKKTIQKDKELFTMRIKDTFPNYSVMIPIKHLSKEDFELFLQFILIQTKSSRSRLSICLILKFITANKNFIVTPELKAILKKSFFVLTGKIMFSKFSKSEIRNSKLIAIIFINTIFKKQNTEKSLAESLNFFVESVEPFLDSAHPKEKPSTIAIFFKEMMKKFLFHYCKNVKKVKDQNMKEKIKEVVEDVIYKYINFSIFKVGFKGLNNIFELLVLENKDKFLPLIMKRIRLGLNEDSFKKSTLILYLAKMIQFICEDEKYIDNIYWIIPALANRLRDTSDSSEMKIICKCFQLMFEFFSGIDDLPEYSYLEELKEENIEESAIEFFKLLLKKGKDISVTPLVLNSVFSLSKFVFKKSFQNFKKKIMGGSNSMSPKNINTTLCQLFFFDKQATEDLIKEWIMKYALKKTKTPTLVKDLLFGETLKSMGIEEIEFKLATDNSSILAKYISVANVLMSLGMFLSEDLVRFGFKFFALCLESKEEKILNLLISGISTVFYSSTTKLICHSSKPLIKKSIKENSKQIPRVQWLQPCLENRDRLKVLFQAIVLKTFQLLDKLMKQFVGDSVTLQEVKSEDVVIQLYKQFIKQGDEDISVIDKLLNNKDVHRIVVLIRILNGVNYYTFHQLSISPKFLSYLCQFKARYLDFLVKSKLLLLGNKRKDLMQIFLSDIQSSFNKFEFIYAGTGLQEQVNIKQVIKNKCASSQLKLAYYRIGKWLMIRKLCGLNKESSFFNETLPNSEYFTSLNLPDFQFKKTESKFIFSGFFYDYLVKKCIYEEYYNLIFIFLRLHSKQKLDFTKTLIIYGAFKTSPFYIRNVEKLSISMMNIECVNKEDSDIIFRIVTEIPYLLKPTCIEHQKEKDNILQITKIAGDKTDRSKTWKSIKSFVTMINDSICLVDFQGETNTKDIILSKLSLVDLNKKEGVLELLSLLVDISTSCEIYKDDVPFLTKVLLKLFKMLVFKNISKRVLVQSGITFIQQMIINNKVKLLKIYCDDESFYNESGICAGQDLKKMINYLKTVFSLNNSVEVNEKLKKKFEFDDSWNIKALNFPITLKKVVFEDLMIPSSEYSEEDLDSIIINLKDLIEMFIQEEQYIDKLSFQNLLVPHNFVMFLLKFGSKFGNRKYSSLLFPMALQSLLISFGFKFYKKCNALVKEMGKKKDKNEQFWKFEHNFMSIVLGVSAVYYTFEQYDSIADDYITLIRPYMNPFKQNCYSVVQHSLLKTLKNTISFKKINLLLEKLISLFDSLTNTCSKNNVLFFVSIVNRYNCRLSSHDQLVKFNSIIQTMKLDTFEDYKGMAYFLIGSFLTYVPDAWNIDIILKTIKNKGVVSIKELTNLQRNLSLVYDTSVFNPQKLTELFFDNIIAEKMSLRFTVLNEIFIYFSDFEFRQETHEVNKMLISLILSLDSSEDESTKNLIMIFQKSIRMLFSKLWIRDDYKPILKQEIQKCLPQLQSDEKRNLFNIMFAVLAQDDVNEETIDFLAKIGTLDNNNTKVSISSCIIIVLSELSDNKLKYFADYIAKKMDKFKKSKENELTMLGYGVILMNIVVLRKWQLGETVETSLQAILRNKNKSKKLDLKYNVFISDFWKKRYNDVELSLKPFSDELSQKLEDYKLPYSYFV